MHFSQAERIAMYGTQNDGKVPLKRRKQVNHVIEGHGTIISIL